jgi:hypothetical protein
LLAKSRGTILDKTLSEPFDFGQKLWFNYWQYVVRAICFGPKVVVLSSEKCCQSLSFLAKRYGTIIIKMLSELFIFGQTLWYHS